MFDKGALGRGSSRGGGPVDFPACVSSQFCPGETRLIGMNSISRHKPKVRGRLPKSGSPRSSLAVVKPSKYKGDSVLEEFLICANKNCRFLVSLREGTRLLRRSDLVLSVCPECSQQWSSQCPFCAQSLDVILRNQVPSCAHCSKPLKPDTPVE
jgi:hypothetical protein